MAIWKKIDRYENSEGTTITYAAEGAGRRVLVQSRKRHIPHAASKIGGGTWDCTSYFVLDNGVEVNQCYTLSRAKEYAERLILGGPV